MLVWCALVGTVVRDLVAARHDSAGDGSPHKCPAHAIVTRRVECAGLLIGVQRDRLGETRARVR